MHTAERIGDAQDGGELADDEPVLMREHTVLRMAGFRYGFAMVSCDHGDEFYLL